MSEAVARGAATGWPRGAAVGFCGKIPARGDFVRAGLPRAFTEPWDRWMQQMIPASRSVLGEEAWVAAWLEAPVWRFALSPRICGPQTVIGVWMPSVDSVGRYYPLTLAAAIGDADHCRLMREAGGFLAAAEDAGRDALQYKLAPDGLAVRLAAAATAAPSDPAIDTIPATPKGALWWTDGAPRVPARFLKSRTLPDEKTFVGMVDSCISMLPENRPD